MSTHLPLSVSRIKRAKAIGRDRWLSDDDGTRGAGRLVLRVTTAGTRLFYFRPARSKGSSGRAIPLGVYSRTTKPNRLTLTQARSAAALLAAPTNVGTPALAALARLARGRSVEPTSSELPPASVPRDGPAVSEGAEARVRMAQAPIDGATPCTTLSEVCRNYVQWMRSAGKVSARDVENYFKRFIYPADIGKLAAADVTSEKCLALLRSLKDKPNTQKKLRSYLQSAYAQAIRAPRDMTMDAPQGEAGISINPIKPIEYSGPKTNVRPRFLTVQELRALWMRMQLSAEAFGCLPLRAARLALLLGGQRCEQLLRVRRAQLDVEAGTILLMDPKGQRETPRPHLLPLAPQAKAELVWLRNYSASVKSPFLFPAKEPSEHLSAIQVSKLVTAWCRAMTAAHECDEQFQFSDFRRTAETQLAACGVPSDTRKHL